MSYWRGKSRSVITKALEEGRAAGLDGKELLKYVDDQYPFNERLMHPYEIWLDERKKLLRNLIPPRPKSKEPLPSLDRPGFLHLTED